MEFMNNSNVNKVAKMFNLHEITEKDIQDYAELYPDVNMAVFKLGDISNYKAAIRAGLDPYYFNGKDSVATWFVTYENAEGLENLFLIGYNFTEPINGKFLFDYAIGHPISIEFLKKVGADPAGVRKRIISNIENGNTKKTFRDIMILGAKNQLDNNLLIEEKSILMAIIRTRNVQLLETFLELGGNPLTQENGVFTVIFAIETGDPKMYRPYLDEIMKPNSRIPVEIRGEDLNSLLHVSAAVDDELFLILFEKSKKYIYTKNKIGYTPLDILAKYNRAGVIRHLVGSVTINDASLLNYASMDLKAETLIALSDLVKGEVDNYDAIYTLGNKKKSGNIMRLLVKLVGKSVFLKMHAKEINSKPQDGLKLNSDYVKFLMEVGLGHPGYWEVVLIDAINMGDDEMIKLFVDKGIFSTMMDSRKLQDAIYNSSYKTKLYLAELGMIERTSVIKSVKDIQEEEDIKMAEMLQKEADIKIAEKLQRELNSGRYSDPVGDGLQGQEHYRSMQIKANSPFVPQNTWPTGKRSNTQDNSYNAITTNNRHRKNDNDDDDDYQTPSPRKNDDYQEPKNDRRYRNEDNDQVSRDEELAKRMQQEIYKEEERKFSGAAYAGPSKKLFETAPAAYAGPSKKTSETVNTRPQNMANSAEQTSATSSRVSMASSQRGRYVSRRFKDDDDDIVIFRKN